MDTSLFEDEEDAKDGEIGEGREHSVEPSISDTKIPSNQSETGYWKRGHSSTSHRKKESRTQDYAPLAAKTGAVSDSDTDGISVCSDNTSRSRRKRRKRKLTDSISELHTLGSSLSPLPKRVRNDSPVGVFSPPRPSPYKALPVFAPSSQPQKTFKKRKSGGIMGF